MPSPLELQEAECNSSICRSSTHSTRTRSGRRWTRCWTPARYILGPAVAELEQDLAAYLGVKHAIGCASGTDALLLALMALELKPGDEVIVPDFTFFATAEVVSLLGANAGVRGRQRRHPQPRSRGRWRPAITPRTRGIIAVSLYGQCADFDELAAIARQAQAVPDRGRGAVLRRHLQGAEVRRALRAGHHLLLPGQAAGRLRGRRARCSRTTTRWRSRSAMLLNHGQTATYRHRLRGHQRAAGLPAGGDARVKLRHFPEELEQRQQVAGWYDERAGRPGVDPAWCARATAPAGRSTRCAARSGRASSSSSRAKGIPTAIHYPMPAAPAGGLSAPAPPTGTCPVSVRASEEVFSLPMHPFLTREEVNAVAAAIREARAMSEPVAGRDRRGPHGHQPRAGALGDGERAAGRGVRRQPRKRPRRSPAGTWSRRPTRDVEPDAGQGEAGRRGDRHADPAHAAGRGALPASASSTR